jgi:Na+/H+ antiporter NhaD/arsenite permease-like protein
MLVVVKSDISKMTRITLEEDGRFKFTCKKKIIDDLDLISSKIDESVFITLLGIASAIIDNVPLVAASIGMFTQEADATLWHFIAYAAGTGGSMLIIGSAAGVVAMGMEKISFFWYLTRISALAAIGYFAGIGVFLLLS